MTKRLLAAIPLLAAAAAAPFDAPRAQSLRYGALEQLFGEAVTTSVTGSPQRQSEVPATMEIITADEIRRSSARDIPGILRDVTGVDVMRWTHDHADVAVRGYNQAFTPRLLVLIDGRQVYADHYGYTPWPTLPVELGAIRQIEIVKGPSSALFGFNAVGGVINIVTFNPLHESMRTASAAAGTQDLGQASSVMTYELGDAGAVMISAGSRRSDDFSTPLRQPGSDDVRRGNARDALTIDARFAARDNVEAGLELAYSDAAYSELSPVYSLSHANYTTRAIKADVAADTEYGLIQASLYHNALDGIVDFEFGGDVSLNIDNDVTVATLQDVFKVGTDHTVRVSVERRENGADTTTVEGGHVHYDVTAMGGMWNWSITPSLSLTNAIRYDRLALGRRGTFPPGHGLDNSDWDRTLTERSFNSGLVWQAGEADTLRLMVGRGVQLPSLFNFGVGIFPLGPAGFGTGSPFIDPSVATNYELGWSRSLAALDAELNMSVFRGTTRDLLAIAGGILPTEGPLLTAANVGDSDTTGLEIAIDGTTGEHWRWGAGYVHQHIDDDIAPGFTLTTTLVDYENTTPERQLDANVGWSRGPWSIDATLYYESSTDGIQGLGSGLLGAELVPVSDRVTLGARLAYRLGEHATLVLSGRNLTHDEQVQTSAAAVERTLLARLQWTF